MENYNEYENFCINISKIAGNYVLENFEGQFEIYSKNLLFVEKQPFKEYSLKIYIVL